MIPHGVEIFVGLDPIDLRWSFDRLAGVVTERVGRERAQRRALRVLRQETRRDQSALLRWHRDVLVLQAAGPQHVPSARAERRATSVAIDERALDDLLDGIDIEAKRDDDTTKPHALKKRQTSKKGDRQIDRE